MSKKIKAAIIGPGNIGTDLLIKAQRSELIEPVWMVGVDAKSSGLVRAAEMGLKTTAEGVEGMLSDAVLDLAHGHKGSEGLNGTLKFASTQQEMAKVRRDSRRQGLRCV